PPPYRTCRGRPPAGRSPGRRPARRSPPSARRRSRRPRSPAGARARGCARTPCCAWGTRRSAVEREPGATTACRTPQRASSSTIADASAVLRLVGSTAANGIRRSVAATARELRLQVYDHLQGALAGQLGLVGPRNLGDQPRDRDVVSVDSARETHHSGLAR